MEVNFLVTCLLYQVFIITTSADLKLSFTDLVATVTPVKPKASSSPIIEDYQLPTITNVPNLSEAILEYFNSQFAEENQAPIVGEYSAPLIVTSSSKPLPIKTNRLTNFYHNDSPFLQNIPALLQYENTIPPNNPFSYNSPQLDQLRLASPVIPQYYQMPNLLDQNPYQYGFSQCFDSQPSSYQTEYLSPLPEDVALPCLSMNLDTDPNSFISAPGYDNPFASWSSPIETSTTSLYPLYNLPYPLRYEQLLPEVMSPCYAGTASFIDTCQEHYINNPISYIMDNLSGIQYGLDSVEQSYMSMLNSPFETQQIYACEPQSNLITTSFSPSNGIHSSVRQPSCHTSQFIDPYSVDVPDFTLIPLEFEPIDFKFDSTPHFINHLDSNVEYQNNFVVPDLFPLMENFMDTLDYNLENSFQIFNQEANKPYPVIPDFPDNIPDFIPIPEICIEGMVPEIPLEHLVSDQFLPGISTCRIDPPIHVNVAPSHPVLPPEPLPRVLPKVNEEILNIARKMISQFILHASKKYKYLSQSEPISLCPSLTPISPINSTFRRLVPTETVNILKSSLYSAYKGINALNDDLLSSSHLIMYSPDLSSEDVAITPKATCITDFPPASFSDFTPTQACPSYLPSPIIPSSFNNYVPIVTEPQIVLLKSSKKRPNTLEKLVELILLAELLNENNEINWGVLDNVVKYLNK